MYKILVTGANGFIGKEVCRFLLESGCEVHGLIREGADIPRRLPDVQWHFYQDICDEEACEIALRGIHGVVHLAGRVHHMDADDTGLLDQYRRVNVQGTIQLAKAAVRAGVRRFLYVSSIKAEEGNGFDPYSVSKREAEEKLGQLAADSAVEVVVFRPCLVYGPGVKANFLSLLKAVHSGIPLPLAGINNQRSYLYVQNLTDAIYEGLTQQEAAGCTFQISDERCLSTSELVRYMAAASGVRTRLFRIPGLLPLAGRLMGKSAEIERLTGSLVADIGPIRHKLGWTPPFSVEYGIERTVEWYIRAKGKAPS